MAIAVEINLRPRRQCVAAALVVEDPQADLLEVVLALRRAGRFACGLHRREKQRDQNADDRDDHQQFNEREPAPAGANASFADCRSVEHGVLFVRTKPVLLRAIDEFVRRAVLRPGATRVLTPDRSYKAGHEK